jgi:hypothetical protein
MASIDNIQAKIPLDVVIIGAGIGGLATATVSIQIISQSYFHKFETGLCASWYESNSL